MFTLGHLRTRGSGKIFPFARTDEPIDSPKIDWRGLNRNQKQNAVVVSDIAEEGDSINLEHPDSETRRGRVGKGVANTLTTSCNQGVAISDQRYIDGMSDRHSFAKRKMQGMLDENGNLPEMFNPYNAQEIDEVSPTLTANCDRSTNSSTVLMKQPGFRIRKLTPLECWRLQGVPDHYFDKAKASGVSDSQLYKQAGNACTTNVIYEIARRLNISE